MHHPHEPIMYSRKKFIKYMEYHINVTSKLEMHKSAKTRNTITYFTHIVINIMPEISMTDAQSHQQFISSMIPS